MRLLMCVITAVAAGCVQSNNSDAATGWYIISVDDVEYRRDRTETVNNGGWKTVTHYGHLRVISGHIIYRFEMNEKESNKWLNKIDAGRTYRFTVGSNDWLVGAEEVDPVVENWKK